MMTCGSERSGIASSGIFLIDQTPMTTSDKTKMMTKPRFVAEYSIILLIMRLPSARRQCRLERSHRLSVLLHRNGGLPGPGHRNLDRALILTRFHRFET